MPKSGNSKTNRNKADKLWGEVMHSLFPVCAVHMEGACGEFGDCSGHVEAHHLITRRRGHSRHLPENGIGLCSSHHQWSPDCSPHSGIVGFMEFMEKYRPEQWAWLKENHNKHIADYNYSERIEELKAALFTLTLLKDGDTWMKSGIPFKIMGC